MGPTGSSFGGDIVVVLCSRSVVSNSSQPRGLWPTRLLRPQDFLGENSGVGCHFFLQGISLTQELNPHPLLGEWILQHCTSREAHFLVYWDEFISLLS